MVNYNHPPYYHHGIYYPNASPASSLMLVPSPLTSMVSTARASIGIIRNLPDICSSYINVLIKQVGTEIGWPLIVVKSRQPFPLIVGFISAMVITIQFAKSGLIEVLVESQYLVLQPVEVLRIHNLPILKRHEDNQINTIYAVCLIYL